MFPNTKISVTIATFGKALVNQLPPDFTKEELEEVMSVVITVWNAVTFDAWEQTNKQEKEVLAAIGNERQALLEVKRLIKRKKTKYAHDLRAVGKRWVREEPDGEIIFGCEASADIEKIKLSGKH